MDAICLIAAPKAGTGRLCSVLPHFSELASFPDAAEDLDTLDGLASSEGKRVLAFPLFDGDLRGDDLADRHNVRFVLVVRKQIDAYLDLVCGDEPATLDPASFADWLVAQERWYDRWRNHLNRRGLPCPVLRYESDIDQPSERVMRRFAGAADQMGVLLRLPAAFPEVPLEPKPRLPLERARNWGAFTRDLFSRGLERRAFGYPL